MRVGGHSQNTPNLHIVILPVDALRPLALKPPTLPLLHLHFCLCMLIYLFCFLTNIFSCRFSTNFVYRLLHSSIGLFLQVLEVEP